MQSAIEQKLGFGWTLVTADAREGELEEESPIEGEEQSGNWVLAGARILLSGFEIKSDFLTLDTRKTQIPLRENRRRNLLRKVKSYLCQMPNCNLVRLTLPAVLL